ncbi:5-(carboxyamino)imidazole ribonucleotide mutase [Desulfuromonas acetoxidans]|uniref:N5-carboxyaminoimidazole ribonucleotide mutase n=1 Tax=Desulfuromonas acetoxidans (strain DSM 684 / 11070) TaxID=281689 RepID=Q1JX85_DESA6|nr:5-(carboxyamino)imidazole ribonucleotide mutase [Desulfuromonas acetoxidans]EAT14907.1 phosphoribosylaminoimidazole carboxylase, catalytic subunit [Desulfuromonas acetoxidans DSM 684]MBF0645564.1 5-(carboxyamino)imidazole ribonucleotide mutase [Desulfuromonas acetoxidans]NVD23366.1 5-(carboxyamino)imidazole ribonucleotide mutase [Desulfuromonas acetoxidans]NVE15393.1 5-(carboxyamino)imidazole ribonucleotide mutase [Desulfuromonas acetoxidans]
MTQQPAIGILMGSDSDYDVMVEAAKVLKSFDVPFEMIVSSAHRSPERTADYASTAMSRGVKALIVGAGAAAHLAGVVASETTLPIIGVPIDSSALKGLDALLATVQMPGGIPVATMAIGKAGAKNAGIFAVQLLALSDSDLAEKLVTSRQEMAQGVANKSDKLQQRLAADGL